uniref:Uncharacterized protein n=1 Tax=Arundo donax TaxID=35708 RepID=A0A0A9A3T6_ARUDO
MQGGRSLWCGCSRCRRAVPTPSRSGT